MKLLFLRSVTTKLVAQFMRKLFIVICIDIFHILSVCFLLPVNKRYSQLSDNIYIRDYRLLSDDSVICVENFGFNSDTSKSKSKSGTPSY